jgi:hypothetical protein
MSPLVDCVWQSAFSRLPLNCGFWFLSLWTSIKGYERVPQKVCGFYLGKIMVKDIFIYLL